MRELDLLGADFLADEVEKWTDKVTRVTPSGFSEEHRYLPESVTSIPGYMRFSVNPFMREIVDCFDVDSPVREVNLKKGVQITYSTCLESGVLYFAGHVKTLPMMYITADKELAAARIENNFIPMFNQSGMADIIRSSDEGSTKKTGKTVNHLQFAGGAYLVPFGAQNANKMRQASIAVMLKDEIDGWPLVVGKDGDPDALSDARCSGYWERRKIFRGSTPLIKGTSKIEAAYLRGDQRKYMVRCKHCNAQQELRWETVNRETGVVGGFQWDYDDGSLVLESVRYCCQFCGGAHYEADKERLFSPDHGAEWVPTARPVEPGIRSYHLPALYSPIGMQPWYKCVGDYLKAYDPEAKRVKDIGLYQVFYNNILGEPFEVKGSRIQFQSVSAHRRTEYTQGDVPNKYAAQVAGGRIQMLTCTVDVHKRNLAVAVIGWTRGARCFVVSYDRYEVPDGQPDCTELTSPVWSRLRALIEETTFTADDGYKYPVALTFIDAGYTYDTVCKFCEVYSSGVYPILGRDRSAKSQAVKEFAEFETKNGITGYRVLVDHYKDRIAPVLRREWVPENGEQPDYHFNAPMDLSDEQLRELTVETRKEKTDERGNVSYIWHRPGNARNELFDLLVYGHAAVELMAFRLCVEVYEMETVNWSQFWDYVEAEKLYYTPPTV